jgi:hypothetical protein
MANIIMAILFIGASFLVPGTALAHGTGASLEKIVGEYRLDIGYNPTILEAQDPSIFDFDLLFDETGERAAFTDMWVRIVQGRKTVFASGIHKPDFGNTTMVYSFPEKGDYELTVRFQNEEEKIVEGSFLLEVQGRPEASGPGISFPWFAVGIFIGIVAGFLTSFAIRKKP